MIRRKIAESRAKRGAELRISGPVDWLAWFISTAGGAGMIPFGPGTWGSLVGLLLVYGMVRRIPADPLALQNALLLSCLLVTAIGIWAGDRAERIFGKKDPGQVVIDEVAGQMISFVFLPVFLGPLGSRWLWWLIPGFVLFRFADIFKPYPIDQLQHLAGGFGVMMDDVLAGIYAAVGLSFLLWIFA
jgi:phosphatidylglycerophosphatase A